MYLPPISEQYAITNHLDTATADFDIAIARARRQIELLEEYRTRLIADVVTGKLDVRAAAAQLPDEADDLDTLAVDGSQSVAGSAPIPAGALNRRTYAQYTVTHRNCEAVNNEDEEHHRIR